MRVALTDLMDDHRFDVVVVGAGAAGMTAALIASLHGASALLVEHTAVVGGTTAYSAGSAWIPNTRHAALVRADDSVEKAATYLRHSVGNESSEEMRRAFLKHGPDAVAELEAKTDVQFRARTLHPDYNSQLEGSTLRGRVLEAAPFDGRKLGRDLALVREPIPEFTVLGGMMVNQEDVLHLLRMQRSFASLRHGVSILARHARDRLTHKRGTRLMMGNALVARLLHSLNQRGVPILTNTGVEEIVLEEGAVRGVVLRQGDLTRRVTVTRGLIAATGGFGRHPARRAQMLRKPVAEHCPGAPGHTGALHDLILKVGARYGEDGRDAGFWSPVSVRRRADGSTAVFPHFLLDRGRPGTVTVNAAGERFVNEALSYHPFTQGMYEANARSPAIPAFLITDEDGLRTYGLGMVRPGRFFSRKPYLDDGYLTQGDTLAQLAAKLRIDATGLETTVAKMNRYAASGIDPDFHRGETDYQRITAGDMLHRPNPCLGPIRRAPFYAVKLYPGEIGTSVGMVTDQDARVLDRDGTPIGGLYACGNDMHSVMGGNYPGPGITIGPAIAFGYAAAKHAAARMPEAQK